MFVALVVAVVGVATLATGIYWSWRARHEGRAEITVYNIDGDNRFDYLSSGATLAGGLLLYFAYYLVTSE